VRGSGYPAFPGIVGESSTSSKHAVNLKLNKGKLGGPPRQSLVHFAHQQVGSLGSIDADRGLFSGGFGAGPKTARTGGARGPPGATGGGPAAHLPPGGVSSDNQVSGYMMKASQVFSQRAGQRQPTAPSSNAQSTSQRAGGATFSS